MLVCRLKTAACLQNPPRLIASRPTAVTQQRPAAAAGKPTAGFADDRLVSVTLPGYLNWCRNFLRRRPAVGVAFVVVLVVLLAGAVRVETPAYRSVLWVLLEALAFGWLLLTGLGYTGTLARKVDRNLQQQREAIIDALARQQKQAAAVDSRLTGMAEELKSAVAGLEKISATIAGLPSLVKKANETADRVAAGEMALPGKLASVSRLAEDARAIAGQADTLGKTLLLSASMYIILDVIALSTAR